ncbi:hypothetical protein [Cupriavidus numazuensis]|uniref:hypothetical protein n=1 Tax=Cupriavidus numazuensis TaxID=221992 RepID=UPI001BA51DBF|nr:hypothetical protein [Cupriavidus numazuensis]
MAKMPESRHSAATHSAATQSRNSVSRRGVCGGNSSSVRPSTSWATVLDGSSTRDMRGCVRVSRPDVTGMDAPSSDLPFAGDIRLGEAA